MIPVLPTEPEANQPESVADQNDEKFQDEKFQDESISSEIPVLTSKVDQSTSVADQSQEKSQTELKIRDNPFLHPESDADEKNQAPGNPDLSQTSQSTDDQLNGKFNHLSSDLAAYISSSIGKYTIRYLRWLVSMIEGRAVGDNEIIFEVSKKWRHLDLENPKIRFYSRKNYRSRSP